MNWRNISIDTHNCHLAITACGDLEEAARAMLAALKTEMALVGRTDISGTAFLLACADAHKASRTAIRQAEAAGIKVQS